MQPGNSKSQAIILLVEDNAADVTLVEVALASAQLDCGLHVVNDGAVAIEYLEKLDTDASYPCPDLIVLDLNLPKVSGEEVLKRLRASSRCINTKVLVVSSSDAPNDRERALSLGASDYFRKPSSLREYMELGPKIRSFLGS